MRHIRHRGERVQNKGILESNDKNTPRNSLQTALLRVKVFVADQDIDNQLILIRLELLEELETNNDEIKRNPKHEAPVKKIVRILPFVFPDFGLSFPASERRC
jgi:hypothetical protein